MRIRFLVTYLVVSLLFWGFITEPVSAQGSAEDIFTKYQKKEFERFTIYSQNPGHFHTAYEVLTKAERLLAKYLNDSLDYKPVVFIADNRFDFEQLVGGRFPDWGAAVAIPERQMIMLKSPDKFNLNKPMSELLAHEYTHLLIQQKSGLFSPPRWLNEGMAMFISVEWSWSYNLAMSKAAVFGQFISLQEIEKMNRFNSSVAQVAYAESYLAVEYLMDNYSGDVVEKFLIQIAGGIVLNKALYNVTGLSYIEFEADFKIYLNQRFNVISLFMDTILLWLFLAVVVVVGFFIRFKKRRSYYRKWEEEEKYHSTDFDYGDSNNPEHFEDDDEQWRS